MRVRDITFDEWLTDFEVLYQMHFLEVLAPRGYLLKLDHDFYRSLEDALKIIGVFDDNHIPVGYSMSIISPDIQADDTLVAYTVAFYLHPDAREGMAGVKLLRVTEAAMAAAAPGGRWRVGIPIDGERDTGRVLERVGLRPMERVYSKLLASGEADDGEHS
jgi:hypothetical protein